MSAMTARTNRQLEVAFVVAPGAELVDIAGPWGVFEYTTSPTTGRSPFALSVVAETADPLKLSGGMRVVPGHTFTNCRTPDIVVVPAIGVEFSDGLLDWLRASHGHASVTMSVCNGAFALAAAGLLDGRTATCHHGSYRLMQSLYPTVTIERGVRWVDHGDIATAGGLTSGTDLALRIVDRLFGAAARSRTRPGLRHGRQPRRRRLRRVQRERPRVLLRLVSRHLPRHAGAIHRLTALVGIRFEPAAIARAFGVPDLRAVLAIPFGSQTPAGMPSLITSTRAPFRGRRTVGPVRRSQIGGCE